MSNLCKKLVGIGMVLICSTANSQDKKFSITGSAGITYEHYGLSRNPAGNNFITPRRAWNQVRFLFNPTMSFGKNFSLPFNINFAAIPTNFAGPYSGIKNPNFGQWITNPANSFGINPKYKWAELLLGTQYINYSNLSTGDVGIFGAGVALHPATYVFKFFSGFSQLGVNYAPPPFSPPGTQGSYKRNHWMMQVGKVKEDNYRILLNISRGEDRFGTLASPPPTIQPQEGFNYSVVADKYFKKNWFIKLEGAQSYFTKNKNSPSSFNNKLTFDPFIFSRASTQKDYAGEATLGKKSDNFDLSYTTKYIGAGFQTMGYPYMQPDHWDNTLNTRFNAMKNKMNVTASAGIRTNNVSNVSLKSRQFIGNINWYTQFDEHFSLNLNYNNFGFTAASGLNPFGIKNVSNDFGVSPSYTWTTTKMSHLFSLSYNYSKYDERDVFTGLTTANNTHTALLSYIPTFLTSELSTDFSVLYFRNVIPAFKNSLLTFSSSVSMPAAKKKMQMRAQLQYTIGKLNAYTPNNNLTGSLNLDYKISKQLTWNNFLSTNYFKYGDELNPPAALIGANYLENTFRSGLKYTFK